MRQAYDYWQNQPGNYPRGRGRAPGGDDRQTPRFRGRKFFVTGRGAVLQAPNPLGPLRTRREAARAGQPMGHPIAPTEFPKGWSAAGAFGLLSRHALPHRPLRWSVPVPSHARRRLPVRAWPRRSRQDVGHRPATYRPQYVPAGEPAGLLFPPQAPSSWAAGSKRQDTSALRGTSKPELT